VTLGIRSEAWKNGQSSSKRVPVGAKAHHNGMTKEIGSTLRTKHERLPHCEGKSGKKKTARGKKTGKASRHLDRSEGDQRERGTDRTANSPGRKNGTE